MQLRSGQIFSRQKTFFFREILHYSQQKTPRRHSYNEQSVDLVRHTPILRLFGKKTRDS